ncbi:MAG: PadR family transcriptional regulator [Saprospiraceae bacterium]|nr:PadR family transcriptional regulator [Saprospiraceae bacterium]
MTRTTNLDYAILGLLEQGAKTGYAIRQVFEQTALGNYSSSPGSIYPALRKLEKVGYIEKCLPPGEKKRQFELTAAGKDKLLEWLNAPLPEEDISKHLGEVLLKFAFMENLLALDKRLHFLSDLAERIEQSLDWLNTIHRDYSHTMSLHSKLALENGIEGQKAHLRWAKHAYQALLTSRE